MKPTSIVGAALLLASTLTGCVVAPVAEPVVYAAPPPPAAVVVHPAYGRYHHHYYHRHGPYSSRYYR
jgi:hypothetical protein